MDSLHNHIHSLVWFEARARVYRGFRFSLQQRWRNPGEVVALTPAPFPAPPLAPLPPPTPAPPLARAPFLVPALPRAPDPPLPPPRLPPEVLAAAALPHSAAEGNAFFLDRSAMCLCLFFFFFNLKAFDVLLAVEV